MHLDNVKTRLAELNSISLNSFKPCTPDEVIALEKQLGFVLPGAYREFLLWMGHGAGTLLQGSDCFYKDILHIHQGAIELLNENNFPLSLPDDAFVFFMHQGYQFNFFYPTQGEDPQIYFYGEWTKQTEFTCIYSSFSTFLSTEIEDHAKLVANFQTGI